MTALPLHFFLVKLDFGQGNKLKSPLRGVPNLTTSFILYALGFARGQTSGAFQSTLHDAGLHLIPRNERPRVNPLPESCLQGGTRAWGTKPLVHGMINCTTCGEDNDSKKMCRVIQAISYAQWKWKEVYSLSQ